MKCTSAFFLCAAAMFAQEAGFTTGQAARLVIGQTTFTSQDTNSSDTILGAAGGLAYGGDTLLVTDANRVGAFPSNHRVLVYRGLSSMLPAPTDELFWNQKCPVCVGRATVVLGQSDFTSTAETIPATQSSLRQPTAIATDGVHVVVADTNHNRVLIWNRIPSINNQPADVVVGQDSFTTATIPFDRPTAKSMRGPQGVWIANGKLFVADTQNNRVLIYNRIPTTNGAAADVVLGVPNFTTPVQTDLTQQNTSAAANNMLNPVAVSSDGQRLFVTDLGYNRVLIWNSIPGSNGAPANVVIGQPDMNSSIANYGFSTDPNDTTQKQTPVMCQESNGTDSNGNPTYPARCNSTMNFPRFALSTGDRLFVADGGNDRVLVFNTIPTTNAASADIILGQIGGSVNQASDASDSLRTPLSMAWDGTNLYVSDAFNRRVNVYSMGQTTIPYQGVRNAASLAIFATANVSFSGTIHAGDVITVKLGGTEYKYTVKADDTALIIIQGLVDKISENGGDPHVIASVDSVNMRLQLRAKTSGPPGNDISLEATTSSGAQIVATASGASFSGGGDTAKVAPGTIVAIQGTNLAASSASADLTKSSLPNELAGAQVYFNGIRAPLFMVTPTQINAQIPWEVQDTSSINAYVRTVMPDGTVQSTTPVAVSIVKANPGIFAMANSGEPPKGLVYHGSSSATGIVSIDGSATASDVATITIDNRSYSYTVQTGDTLDSIRDHLIELINQDPLVTASASGVFDRIIIRSRVQGPDGNGIPITATSSSGASVIVSAFTPNLCCANVAGSLVTPDNPAVPGEILFVQATGLGIPVLTEGIQSLLNTGVKYPEGGPQTQPNTSDQDTLVSSLSGGKTADVLAATLQPGTVGTYLLVLHLNSDLPTDPNTQLTIAQGFFTSNVVTFPLVNPNQTQ